jgi:hypothetical protein
MVYVEMRHSGISHDIKTELDVIPRVGEIVDFSNNDEHHLFRVDRVVHCYDDHRLEKIYISGTQISNWTS